MKKVFKRIKNNNLLKIMSIAIVALFISLVARVTYAFFAPSVNSGLSHVQAGNDTVDAFKLEVDSPLTINATPTTLPENGENLVSSTYARARLRANSTENKASYEYFLYLNLSDNTFVYSDGTTPEIILSVVDPNGNPITSIEGLEYGTYNGVEGFDVTTKEGMFLLSNSVITSNSSTNETINEWQVTLTYLNLPIDQSINYGHSMITELKMQKEKEVLTIAKFVKGLYTDGSNGLYYHDSNLVNGANDNSYRFSGANPNNWICFGTDTENCDNEHLYRIIGLFNENNVTTNKKELRVKIIKAYEGTSSSLGKAPNKNLTPNTTYYKGTLKALPAYYWSGGVTTNTWTNSTLNSSVLNGNYLNTLGNIWSSKIAITEWVIAGNSNSMVYSTPAASYQKEIVNPMINDSYLSSGKTTNAKVGLMYISDYAFAASPENWSKTLSQYESDLNRENNWMHLGNGEFTITRVSEVPANAFYIHENGKVSADGASYTYPQPIRPCFSLESSVAFVSGNGTSTDPYRVA